MNNLLSFVLGALVLMTLYYWVNGGVAKRAGSTVLRSAGRVGRLATGTAGNIIGQVGETVEDISETVGGIAGDVGETAGKVFGGITRTVGKVYGDIGETIGETISGVSRTAGDIYGDVGGTVGDITEQVGKQVSDIGRLFPNGAGAEPNEVEMAVSMSEGSIPDLGHGAPTGPAGVVNVPMADVHSAGYPSGILPGKVGTFHPTNDCDRFICNGCTSCAVYNSGCCMTDDRGRNYPALIDKIRVSRTNEYPFYKLN